MEKSTDIRTLLFYKIKPGCQEAYNNLMQEEKDADLYVTIGNYDALMIYPTEKYSEILSNNKLEKEDALTMFLNEKRALTEKYMENDPCDCTRCTFFHPFHIIKHVDNLEEIQNVKNFWNISNARTFLVVTFVYGLLSENQTSFEFIVKNAMPKMDNENPNLIEYQIYRSINMSRLVVLWKGNSLKNILEAISKLSSCKQGINTHTICGFKYTKLNNGSISATNVIPEDTLDMVKITGTIRSYDRATEQFSNIKNLLKNDADQSFTDFLAFGSNDFNLIYNHVPTVKLINLLNDWMKHTENGSCHKLENAFSSIKTRVHIDYANYEDNVSNYFNEVSGIIVSSLNVLKNFNSFGNWTYSLIETVNMLKDMSQNPAVSRTIYFVAKSLQTLCESLDDIRLNNSKEECEAIIKHNQKRINKYTSALNSLINQLIRVDGYLSQEPGFTPLIYNMIPAGLLGYYYSFICFVIDAIKNLTLLDKQKESVEFSMLLIPSLSRYIKIDDVLFQSTHNKKPVYPKKQLYLVEIPYDMLYKPDYLLCAVVHEIMHFCGETIRCRETRYKTFLSFLSEAICTDFGIVCSSNLTSDYLYNILKGYIKENEDGIFLKNLTEKSKMIVKSVYQNRVIKSNLHELYSSTLGPQQKINEFKKIQQINAASVRAKLLTQIDSIEYLFRECHADLITFILLGFSCEDYLRIILNDISKIPNDNDKEVRSSTFEERIALVIYTLKVCEKNGLINNNLDFNVNAHPILEKVNILINLFETKNIVKESKQLDTNLYFPIRCLLNISDYLQNCCEKLINLYNEKNKNIFENIKFYYDLSKDNDSFFNDKYCELIDKMVLRK